MKLSACLTISFACLVAAGCGSETVALKPTPFDTAAAKAREITAATEEAATDSVETTTSVASKTQAIEQEYTPPYPERDTLFSPPKRQSLAGRSQKNNSSDSVVLLGFADLDGPRALLSVDRLVRPLAVGQEAAGVKVISISNPRVVLQRGSTRWTATIE